MDFDNPKSQKSMGEALEDRINQLPDSVLHHILSSSPLDIKDVARTCVLSKRWKHIWTSIPTLDFRFWILPPSTPEINKSWIL
ncbi:hypothetical protein C5167_014395 [Papaver somniferum]|uniref:F-box domain-containing protein n=1 Tax=Papaver somniferum TaxID=3469 RepID=A0A4Y7J6H5_PAPSO|nr:hypothetical protein C5167_014395 [Papaver somniferum]